MGLLDKLLAASIHSRRMGRGFGRRHSLVCRGIGWLVSVDVKNTERGMRLNMAVVADAPRVGVLLNMACAPRRTPPR
jgi:hypothetical protein